MKEASASLDPEEVQYYKRAMGKATSMEDCDNAKAYLLLDAFIAIIQRPVSLLILIFGIGILIKGGAVPLVLSFLL